MPSLRSSQQHRIQRRQFHLHGLATSIVPTKTFSWCVTPYTLPCNVYIYLYDQAIKLHPTSELHLHGRLANKESYYKYSFTAAVAQLETAPTLSLRSRAACTNNISMTTNCSESRTERFSGLQRPRQQTGNSRGQGSKPATRQLHT